MPNGHCALRLDSASPSRGGKACVVVDTTQETERTYELPDGKPLWSLVRWSRVEPRELPTVELDADYFDTAGLRLLRAGLTLRRRVGGDDAGWHLKLPSSADTRVELRLPPGASEDEPPAEFLKLVRVHVRDEPVRLVARLQTVRRRLTLTTPEGAAVAELAEDEVIGTVSAFAGGGAQVRWREVEVELSPGAETAALDDVEADLLEAGARPGATSVKLKRVLAAPLAEGQGGRREQAAATTAGDVVLAGIADHTAALRRHDPLVRVDAPESVHSMRKTARRMRSTVKVYRRILDPEATAQVGYDLQWVGRALSGARDLEVLEEYLDDVLEQLPEDVVVGPVAKTLAAVFERGRAESLRAGVDALDSDRYLATHAELDELLENPPLTDLAEEGAAERVRAELRREAKRLRRRMRRVTELEAGPEHDEAVHDLRKGAKRLRYATDVAVDVLGKPAQKLAKRLGDFQDVLGERQDAVTAQEFLADVAAGARERGEDTFTYGVMVGQERARALRLEAQIPGVWEKVWKAAKLKP